MTSAINGAEHGCKRFKIYGDYGYQSETLLEEFDRLDDATRWLKRYVRWGNMGGFDIIEVAHFAPDGEYLTHETIRADND
jgi:hypothetical protein